MDTWATAGSEGKIQKETVRLSTLLDVAARCPGFWGLTLYIRDTESTYPRTNGKQDARPFNVAFESALGALVRTAI